MTAAQLSTLAPMIQGDARDAHLFNVYVRMRLTVHGRHAILSGIAGFQREVTV
jgi:hypothetical protein